MPLRPPLIIPIRRLPQFAVDVLYNPVLPPPVIVPAPFNPQLAEFPQPSRQYIPDVQLNQVALGVSPGTESLIERDLVSDVFAPKRQYVPDVLVNPVALAAVAAQPPFIPVNFDIVRSPQQYVPDAIVNATIVSNPQPAPFIRRCSIRRAASKQQYVPHILRNPVALAIPPPVMRWLGDIGRPPRQYVPDVAENATILLQALLAPFTPVAFVAVVPRRQYVPDVVPNTAVQLPLLPFIPTLFDQPRSTRQYVPDVFGNQNVPGVTPPFVPFVLFETPKLRPSRMDAGVNAILPLNAQLHLLRLISNSRGPHGKLSLIASHSSPRPSK